MVNEDNVIRFPEPEFPISLNRYQRDNLLWLLNLIWDGYLNPVNTGDWVGEISTMLSPETGGRLLARHKPNVEAAEWIRQNCPEKLEDYLKWLAHLEVRFGAEENKK